MSRRETISSVERGLWGDAVVEAFDVTESAYKTAEKSSAPAEVVELLRKASSDLFAARVMVGL